MAPLKMPEVTYDDLAHRPGGIEKNFSRSIHVMVHGRTVKGQH